MMAIRFMCRQMLDDPFGFLSFCGEVGNAKSLALQATVTEFCRSGRHSLYYVGDEIAANLNASDMSDPAAFAESLKNVPVLAIDEIDKMKWTDHRVMTLGGIIDYRYRNPDTHVTLLSMNRHPSQWDETEHIASRLMDGRFSRVWPAEHASARPACAFRDGDEWLVPGLLELTLTDMRPYMRRG
jgi:DNA replication protein DnaC